MQRAHTFVAWCVGKESLHARSSSVNHDDHAMNRAAGWIGAMQQSCVSVFVRSVDGTKCWVEIERTCIWPSSFCTFRHHSSTWCTLLEVSHSTSHSQVDPRRTVQHGLALRGSPRNLLRNLATSSHLEPDRTWKLFHKSQTNS
jgi:hypothetical protein